jgi:hypothetical protein
MVDSFAIWQHGVATVRAEYARLPAVVSARVTELAAAIRAHKVALDAFIAGVEGGAACAACQGACCSRGKYHFSLVDLLVYLAADIELFTPRFAQDACPFLGDSACLMPPALRPLACITFNCEQVEALLPPLEQARFAAVTEELKGLYQELEELLCTRLRGGLLHYSEQSLASDGAPILKLSSG